ncbi:MAG: SpoIIE family protein phosphatase [Calditrichaeota bacterium]|nr:SpoIIE family protein phosphatase [Calditrichota bacterium]
MSNEAGTELRNEVIQLRLKLRRVIEAIDGYSTLDEAFGHVDKILSHSFVIKNVDLLVCNGLSNSFINSKSKITDLKENKLNANELFEVKTFYPKVTFQYFYPIYKSDRIAALFFFNGTSHFDSKSIHCNELMSVVSTVISYLLSHFSVIAEHNELLREMDLLHEISKEISGIKALPELLDDIMTGSKVLMNAEASSLLLYDETDDKLYFQIAQGEMGTLVKQFSVDMGSGIAGWVAKYQQPLVIEDCYKDPRFNPSYDKKTGFRTKSMICVPMLRDNKLIGTMQVINKKDDGVFTNRELKIFTSLAAQAAIAIQNFHLVQKQIETEALERELKTARTIQEKLLPEVLPDYQDLEVAAKLIPAKQVGGDFYDIMHLNDKYSLFIVCDVAGKGIPAALIVSTIYSSLNTYLQGESFDLISLVTRMNKLLIKATTADKYATAWFGLYDHQTQVLQSVNAGHNPPYLFSEKTKPSELKVGGIFLGSLDFIPYENEYIKLNKDDLLVFFTDGVTEAWNKEEEDYGEDQLIKVLQANRGKTADEILHAIEKDVERHVAGAPQSDDFTCVVLKKS